jgi:hypothetical protein
MTALDLVYQYRQLVGKCESGAGLDFDEIEALGTIEALFAVDLTATGRPAEVAKAPVVRPVRRDATVIEGEDEVAASRDDAARCRRQFCREQVDLRGRLRGNRANDPVHIVNLGPGGLVCRNAPYVEEGEHVEIIIDDVELSLSYRFKAEVTWLNDDDDDFALGLRFVGIPVLVHHIPGGTAADRAQRAERAETVGDQIAA